MFHLLNKLAKVTIFLIAAAILFALATMAYNHRDQWYYPLEDYWTVRNIKEGIVQAPLENWDGKVIRITGSDSFILKGAAGLCSVKLTGLAGPVATNAFDKALVERTTRSTEYLSSLILSNEVHVVVTYLPSPPVRSGLGLVYMGTNLINSAMVAEGHADLRLDFMNGLPREEQYKLLKAHRTRKNITAVASISR